MMYCVMLYLTGSHSYQAQFTWFSTSMHSLIMCCQLCNMHVLMQLLKMSGSSEQEHIVDLALQLQI